MEVAFCLQWALYVVSTTGFLSLYIVFAVIPLNLWGTTPFFSGLKHLAGAVFFDVFVVNPFIYWPSFYTFKCVGFRDDGDERSVSQAIRHVLIDE